MARPCPPHLWHSSHGRANWQGCASLAEAIHTQAMPRGVDGDGGRPDTLPPPPYSDQVLENVLENMLQILVYRRDRSTALLVCQSWDLVEAQIRHELYVGNYYITGTHAMAISRRPGTSAQGVPLFLQFQPGSTWLGCPLLPLALRYGLHQPFTVLIVGHCDARRCYGASGSSTWNCNDGREEVVTRSRRATDIGGGVRQRHCRTAPQRWIMLWNIGEETGAVMGICCCSQGDRVDLGGRWNRRWCQLRKSGILDTIVMTDYSRWPRVARTSTSSECFPSRPPRTQRASSPMLSLWPSQMDVGISNQSYSPASE
ncbi:hypothetical protein ZIOFF_048200 [Zingiber officinale]|uniref:COI1 F-box domain-containing protein n=1 Tax=Zingiber officinale TaxID=94328 RepID=A0A8J5FQV7_ZINOF|nr:hypothetical protein ZIOFF_048200 [Zingiber officinale]